MIKSDSVMMMGKLYLVVDPFVGKQIILPKIKAALDGGVDCIQLWNNWNGNEASEELIAEVCEQAHRYQVSVIINEHWHYMLTLPVDGVHFDQIPDHFDEIKKQVDRAFITGITCGNDLNTIQWAIDNKLNYISFCSVFPSVTANSCELIDFDLIKQTCASNQLPVYVAGGINCNNISSLLPLGISGVAIASAIMNADNVREAARQFKQSLNH